MVSYHQNCLHLYIAQEPFRPYSVVLSVQLDSIFSLAGHAVAYG